MDRANQIERGSLIEQGPGATETVQLAVPIPRRVRRWFRHYALDQGFSMAEFIRRILRDFMATHRGSAELTASLGH